MLPHFDTESTLENRFLQLTYGSVFKLDLGARLALKSTYHPLLGDTRTVGLKTKI